MCGCMCESLCFVRIAVRKLVSRDEFVILSLINYLMEAEQISQVVFILYTYLLCC